MTKGKVKRPLEIKERHHIIPKCMGGGDSKDNLVELTPREHFIAHILLARIYPQENGLIYAANMMINGCSNKYQSRNNSHTYDWLKRQYIELERNKVFSAATKSKMSEAAKNRPKIKCEHCGSINSHVNHVRWHGDNCKQSPTFVPGSRKHSEEAKSKNKIAVLKYLENPEQIKCDWCDYIGTKSAVNSSHNAHCKHNPNYKKRVLKPVICPHCGKEGTGPNMTRWHFDNCKFKIP